MNLEYESNGEGSKTLSIKEYLDEIKQYLKDIINNLEKFKVHSKSDNIKTMKYEKADKAVEQTFESLLFRYHFGLETSIVFICWIANIIK